MIEHVHLIIFYLVAWMEIKVIDRKLSLLYV